MSETIATFFQLVFQASISGDDYPFGPDTLNVLFPFTQATIGQGTGNAEISEVGVKTITIPASSSVTVSLRTGLEDPRDHAATGVSRVIAMAVYNPHDPDTEPWANVIVGAAASAAFESWSTSTAPTVTIDPGGVWPLYSPLGYTVNSAHENLKFTNPNTNGTMTVHLMVAG